MADNKIEIELDLDTSDVKEGLKKTEAVAKASGFRAGSKFASGFEGKLKGTFGGLKTQILSLGAVLLTTFGARKIIDAAAKQEDAINALNQSLASQGKFTKEASIALQEYASQLQSVTTFGDEAVLEQLAFAQAMGAGVEQSKEVVSAAADLAAALNIDLNSATRNVAKTLGGFAGELGEVIPALKNLSQEQLRAGEGIKVIADIYKGRASGAVNTFSGATQQLSNNFGDLLEEFGFFITRNPAVVAGIKTISDELTKTIKSVSDFRKSVNFKDVGLQAIQFAEVINGTLTRPFVFFANIADATFQGIRLGLSGLLQGFVRTLSVISGIAAQFGFGKKIAADIEQLNQFLLEQQTSAVGNIKELLLGDLTGEETQEELAQFLENYKATLMEIGDVTSQTSNRVQNDVESLSAKLQATGKQLAAIVNQALVKVISAGIQRATQALLKGGDAFQDFGKFVFSVLGDLAIKLGETLILTGIGIESLKKLGGASAIAAGAGLIALGTILKSLGEGPGLGVAGEGAGGFGGSPVPGVSETGIAEEEERQAPGTAVTVNVEGNVFDTEETGLRLVDAINDAFDKSGVTVRTT